MWWPCHISDGSQEMRIDYEIRPICAEEWLPDRCLSVDAPLDARCLLPQHGCPNLLFGKPPIHDRASFVEFYRTVLRRVGCCGFVAWEKDRVIGYTNFFSHEIAREMKFYGWGGEEEEQPDTLVHHCVSLIRNSQYRRQGIGSSLLRRTLAWATAHEWKRYEVHQVLPDIDTGVAAEQKSVLSFWRKIGFAVIREEDADEATRNAYGVETRYSLALELA